MTLFFIGILEMLILTVWTKVVTKSQVLASGIVTVINVLIWYYVLETIVGNINDWRLALLYAFGCAIGTAGSTYYFQWEEKRQRRAKKQKKYLSGGLEADLTINE